MLTSFHYSEHQYYETWANNTLIEFTVDVNSLFPLQFNTGTNARLRSKENQVQHHLMSKSPVFFHMIIASDKNIPNEGNKGNE